MLRHLRVAFWRRIVPLQLRHAGVEVGASVRFLGAPIVSLAPSSTITIGARSVLCSESELTALGVNHPVVLRTLRSGATIQIGEDAGISGGAISRSRKFVIGARFLMGANVTIVDTDFHATDPSNRRYNDDSRAIATAPVQIGDDVFLGTGSFVLKGVTIGDGTIVGAGAVVTRSLPPGVIAAGNPARAIRELKPRSP